MRRRVLLLGLLVLGLGAFYLLFVHREVRDAERPDHLTVRYATGGRVSLGSPPVLVATLPQSRRADPGVWDDAFSTYRRAVRARFEPRRFDAGTYREGAVLTIIAPPETPWRIVEWLMYAAGDPKLLIPTIRLVSMGSPAVRLPIPQDPGHTDAYVMDPPHVHVRPDRVGLHLGGAIAECGSVMVDQAFLVEDRPNPAELYRSASLAADDLAGLTGALQAAMQRSEGWAWRAVALTWPEDCATPFAPMADILRRILEAKPEPLYTASLHPQDTHGR